jgi:hypothetical protein
MQPLDEGIFPIIFMMTALNITLLAKAARI